MTLFWRKAWCFSEEEKVCVLLMWTEDVKTYTVCKDWLNVVFSVIGDRQSVDVTTFVNEDVLLPCSCTNREKISIPRWQTEGNLAELVWFDNKVTNYTGRVETFFNSNINNCSILLKNVTKNDHKKYSCRFTQKTYRYQCNFVNLRVCGELVFFLFAIKIYQNIFLT